MENKETIQDFIKSIYPSPNGAKIKGIELGAKWQQERSYSEEEVHLILGSYSAHKVAFSHKYTYDMWFEQFKKK